MRALRIVHRMSIIGMVRVIWVTAGDDIGHLQCLHVFIYISFLNLLVFGLLCLRFPAMPYQENYKVSSFI